MTTNTKHKSHSATPTRAPKEAPKAPIPVGLDLGYGYVKICSQNTTYTYPALVAPLDPGDITRHLHHPDDIIEHDGNHYLVGQAATRAPFRFREQWDTWWTSPTYQVLLTKAAQLIPKGATIVTGVPLHVYASTQAQAQVAAIIKRLLQAKTVTVLCQGLGVLKSAILKDPTLVHQKIAIADIGSRTTELIGMMGTTFLPNQSRGLVWGTQQIFDTVAKSFSESFHRPVDPFDLETAIQQTTDLTIKHTTIPNADLQEHLKTEQNAFLSHLHEEMSRIWDIKDRHDPKTLAPDFDTIIFSGGGTTLFQTILTTTYPTATIMLNSQLANAQGYLHFASTLNGNTPTS